MSIATAKVPAILATGLICLLLGVAGGIVIASYVDTGLNKQAAANPDETPEVRDVGVLKAGMPGMGKGGGMPGGMPGMGKGGDKGAGGKAAGGGKGGFTPNPKNQLTQLVAKLDTLTRNRLP